MVVRTVDPLISSRERGEKSVLASFFCSHQPAKTTICPHTHHYLITTHDVVSCIHCGMKQFSNIVVRCWWEKFWNKKRRLLAFIFCLCLYALTGSILGKLPTSASYQTYGSSSLAAIANSPSTLHNQHAVTTQGGGTLPLEEAFRLDLDISTGSNAPCAWFKCFFRSQQSTNFGYLVAQERTTLELKLNKFESLEQAYQYAKYLEDNYGIKQFLMEPPWKLNCTNTLASYLTLNSYQQQFTNLATEQVEKKIFTPNQPLYIQKVRVAPTPSLLIGCHHTKLSHAWEELEDFLSQIIVIVNDDDSTTKISSSSSSSSSSMHVLDFIHQLTREVNFTIDLLHREPQLVRDFQVLLDTHGNIYHLDLDRCYEVQRKKLLVKSKYLQSKNFIDCIQNFRNITAHAIRKISRAQFKF